MSSRMPEFEMPSERAPDGSRPDAGVEPTAPQRLAEPGSAPEAASRTVTDEAPGTVAAVGAPVGTASRRRFVIGAVLAGLAIVTLGTAAIVQGVQRAVEEAETAAVRAVALDYLAAIAEGRGDAATALVPVDGDAALLTDAALAGAGRIQQFEVGAVELDGDTAVVDVAFRTGQGRVERGLDAVRDSGSWRLLNSLAERVRVDGALTPARPRLQGIEIGAGNGTLLYPAVYRTERIERALVTVDPSTLVVDGDPSSPTGTGATWAIADGLVDSARELALTHAVACQAGGACAVPPGALLGLGELRSVELVDDDAVLIDVPVQVLASESPSPASVSVPVLATPDAAGAVAWSCAAPEVRDSSATRVVERVWVPCG